LNAKEVELKALQLLAAQKLDATQAAATAIVTDTAKEQQIGLLQSKLEAQQSQHQKQMADLGTQHALQLKSEREKAQPKENGAKPRKVQVERDAQGRISGATIQ